MPGLRQSQKRPRQPCAFIPGYRRCGSARQEAPAQDAASLHLRARRESARLPGFQRSSQAGWKPQAGIIHDETGAF